MERSVAERAGTWRPDDPRRRVRPRRTRPATARRGATGDALPGAAPPLRRGARRGAPCPELRPYFVAPSRRWCRSPPVRKRPLGKTTLQVSELALGTWGLSGDGYGPVADVEIDR